MARRHMTNLVSRAKKEYGDEKFYSTRVNKGKDILAEGPVGQHLSKRDASPEQDVSANSYEYSMMGKKGINGMALMSGGGGEFEAKKDMKRETSEYRGGSYGGSYGGGGGSYGGGGGSYGGGGGHYGGGGGHYGGGGGAYGGGGGPYGGGGGSYGGGGGHYGGGGGHYGGGGGHYGGGGGSYGGGGGGYGGRGGYNCNCNDDDDDPEPPTNSPRYNY